MLEGRNLRYEGSCRVLGRERKARQITMSVGVRGVLPRHHVEKTRILAKRRPTGVRTNKRLTERVETVVRHTDKRKSRGYNNVL